MKKILPLTLLICLFCLPVFAGNFIFVLDSRNSTIFIKPDTIRFNRIDKNIVSFKTHIVFKKGYEKDFSDIGASYEEWNMTANCVNYDYQVESIDFFNKDNSFMTNANTMGVPFGDYSGRARYNSKVHKVINRACNLNHI